MSPQRLPRVMASVAAACALAAGLGHAALAQGAATRKAGQRGLPAQTAPDRTGSVARTQDQFGPPAPLVAEDDAALAFYYLPNAPRTKVRACGETWRAKKMAGEAGDESWRDFAAKCLVAAEAPTSP